MKSHELLSSCFKPAKCLCLVGADRLVGKCSNMWRGCALGDPGSIHVSWSFPDPAPYSLPLHFLYK